MRHPNNQNLLIVYKEDKYLFMSYLCYFNICFVHLTFPLLNQGHRIVYFVLSKMYIEVLSLESKRYRSL